MPGHFLSAAARQPSADHRLVNRTSGTTLALRVQTAFDSAARRRGWMHRDRVDGEAGLVIAPCAAIHTCFMRFPIDVVFVTRDGVVRKVCPEVAPWRARGAWRAFAAIELPPGTARRSGIRPGDCLRVEPVD